MNCCYCGKELKKNGKSHQSFCKSNPNRKSRGGKNNHMFGKKGSNQFVKAKENGTTVFVSEETKEKMSKSQIGKTLSEEHKIKVSESMKLAHLEKRAWNIGKSRWNNAKSYPEKFFTSVIENEFLDKDYECEHNVGIYSIDFAWVSKKLAIEIDGEQHQRFKDIAERDNRKDSFLTSQGWKILRITWKEMYNDPKKLIQKAYTFIHDGEA